MALKRGTKVCGGKPSTKTKTIRKRKGTLEEQQIRDRCTQLRSALRRAWSRDAKRYKCLAENKREYVGDNKRQKYEHQCNVCKRWVAQKDIQVDHIEPCGSLLELSVECVGKFVLMLFEGELQKICKPCHVVKTLEERKAR